MRSSTCVTSAGVKCDWIKSFSGIFICFCNNEVNVKFILNKKKSIINCKENSHDNSIRNWEVYCGNDRSGNPFCLLWGKKIGTNSVYAAQIAILKKYKSSIYKFTFLILSYSLPLPRARKIIHSGKVSKVYFSLISSCVYTCYGICIFGLL